MELSLCGATDMAPELREPSHQQPGDPASGLRPSPKVGQDSETIFYPTSNLQPHPLSLLKERHTKEARRDTVSRTPGARRERTRPLGPPPSLYLRAGNRSYPCNSGKGAKASPHLFSNQVTMSSAMRAQLPQISHSYHV